MRSNAPLARPALSCELLLMATYQTAEACGAYQVSECMECCDVNCSVCDEADFEGCIDTGLNAECAEEINAAGCGLVCCHQQ